MSSPSLRQEVEILKTAAAKQARRLKRRMLSGYDALRVWRTVATWRILCRAPVRSPSRGKVRRVVVMPSDPHTLIGAKGDEAMMRAAIALLASGVDDFAVAAITGSEHASAAALGLGMVPLPVWSRGLQGLLHAIMAFRPDLLLVVGADVMDGFYDPSESAKRLATADLAARSGIRTAVLGFSFSREPHRGLRPLLSGLSTALRLNIRDALSRANFSLASPCPTRLVADMAFLLEPSTPSDDVRTLHEWVTRQRERGNTVLGFNVHPQLVANEGRAAISSLVDSTVDALSLLLRRHAVSIMLLAHDYRAQAADGVCLAGISCALRSEFGERVIYPTQAFSAVELKAIAGSLDGVVTGRMHLAIAALGSGVPVAALTYQDKFQGLFLHFRLPDRFLLSPAHARQAPLLLAMCEAFLQELPNLRREIQTRLPEVRLASRSNLAEFLPTLA